MTRNDDPWKLPALDRLGGELREAESAGSHAGAQHRRRWRPPSLAAAAAIVTLAVIAVVLNIVSPAGALSPINRAPVAAAQSRYVRFSSALEARVNGHPFGRFTEHGGLDFVTGNYDTTLQLGDHGERIERRQVGRTFYGLQLAHGKRSKPIGWRAIRLGGGTGTSSLAAPGAYTLIDPQVTFRVLAEASSAITLVDHERLNGAPSTHYRLTTSLAAFLIGEKSTPIDRRGYNAVPAVLNVWLDRRGRPARVEARFAGASRLGEATMTLTVDFEHYGVPVTVQAPADAALSPRSDTSPVGPLEGDPIRVLERLLFARR